ncbi:unnamed protein product [Periconia digitata]|uniref:Major facilitator superfamily (MFS) profile domain-containing protein n=1 Tax=Periconia digitata TaxID=1303443 RepID=A0A9W4XLH2_9PLEO|nr:unnamed protein product [Periconia digitata]
MAAVAENRLSRRSLLCRLFNFPRFHDDGAKRPASAENISSRRQSQVSWLLLCHILYLGFRGGSVALRAVDRFVRTSSASTLLLLRTLIADPKVYSRMGRITILRFTAALYTVFTIACALSTSLSMLIVFRFFAGCFGGAPMAIGGGVVSDLYAPGKRTRPMAWYSVGTMMSPTLGPVLGGLITGGLDWRWVFWIATILAGLCVILLFFLLEETHQATLTRRAVSRTTDSSQGMNVKPSLFDTSSTNWKAMNVPSLLRRSIILPAKIARHSHALVILVFIGIFNGLVNMILSSLGSVFQFQYGFPPTTAGLAYLGLGIGGVCGLATTPHISDFFSKRRPHQDGSKRPQHALPMMIIGGPMSSIGLWWYGWSTQAKVHWMVPIIGLAIFSYGYISIRVSLLQETLSLI